MVYLFESELDENKPIFFSLTKVYGIGKANSAVICKKLGLSENFKTKSLSKDQITKLINLTDSLNLKLAGDLRKLKLLAVKKLLSIKAYKGLRKNQGLPVRGQRTHTNARTARKRR